MSSLQSPARHFALIPAAGVGARMGATMPKQYLPLAGKAMLLHVLDTFVAADAVDGIFVVVSANDAYIDEAIASSSYPAERVQVLRCGGATRQESVRNGLRAILAQVSESDWVLVHDAARTGLTARLLQKLIDGVGEDAVGGLLALPVADTLKRSDGEALPHVAQTVPRAGLWAAQTPQMFRYALLLRALEQDGATTFTDDASAIEALGLQPRLIEGAARNFKLTTPDDIALMELLLANQTPTRTPEGAA